MTSVNELAAAVANADHPRAPLAQMGRASITTMSAAAMQRRSCMSAEHEVLDAWFRPPAGSLASEAQAAVAKHPDASLGLDGAALRPAAREDAEHVLREHDPEIAPTLGASIDMARVGKTEAAALMSVVHQVLGYRPPPGSLAVTAQAAAKLHSDTGEGMDRATLADAAREDATCVRDE